MPLSASKQLRMHKPPSGLPPVVDGQPFSLIGTLKRTRSLLTVDDVCQILQLKRATVYKHINAGRIPVADVGLDITRIDPAQWALELEKRNEHLKPSVRALKAA